MNKVIQFAVLSSIKGLKAQIQLIEDLLNTDTNEAPLVSQRQIDLDESHIIDNKLSSIFKEDE